MPQGLVSLQTTKEQATVNIPFFRALKHRATDCVENIISVGVGKPVLKTID